MNENIKLRIRKFPKALAELSHSNQFLKISTLSSYGLCALMMIVIFYQATKPAYVLPLAPDASVYKEISKHDPKVEIESAIKEYIKYRYNWSPKTISEQVDKASVFILPSIKKKFHEAMTGVIRFSTEKMVEQRTYPEVTVDLKKNIATVLGDRVTVIQGLKAVGDLSLELSYESGPRTKDNPWGIYIMKEVER